MEAVWSFLIEHGIKTGDLESLKHTTLIILMLPFVITIGGICRYIIGLKSLNIYVTTILTFAFLELGYIGTNNFSFSRGLLYGVILLLATFLTTVLLYKLIRRVRMHYIPKLSLIVTAVSIAFLFLTVLTVLIDRNRFVAVSPVTLIMMIIACDGFISIMAKKNLQYTLSVTFETFLITLISYIFISWDAMQNFVMAYPVIILAVIIVNFFVGKFTGLRLMEYWRFRSIIFNADINNDNPGTNQTK